MRWHAKPRPYEVAVPGGGELDNWFKFRRTSSAMLSLSSQHSGRYLFGFSRHPPRIFRLGHAVRLLSARPISNLQGRTPWDPIALGRCAAGRTVFHGYRPIYRASRESNHHQGGRHSIQEAADLAEAVVSRAKAPADSLNSRIGMQIRGRSCTSI